MGQCPHQTEEPSFSGQRRRRENRAPPQPRAGTSFEVKFRRSKAPKALVPRRRRRRGRWGVGRGVLLPIGAGYWEGLSSVKMRVLLHKFLIGPQLSHGL